MPRLRGGIRPSPFDGRYEQWMGQGTTKAQVELPRVPIKNQGSKVDCCTAMAVCTAMEMVDSSRNNYIPLSPLFNYYYSRVNPDKRLGAVPLSFALRSAMTIGVSSYALHPYQATVDNAFIRPVKNANEQAKYHKIGFDFTTNWPGYMKLDNNDRLNNWRGVLAAGYPVIAAVFLQKSYWDGQGIIASADEKSGGLHAVCVVGFNNKQRVFYVQDSRGLEFAYQGCWLLGYSVLQTTRVHESWTISMLSYDY